PDCIGVGQFLLANDFQGHRSSHTLMARLEYLTHPALAQLVEQLVRSDAQILRPPLRDHVDLKARQPTALQNDPPRNARVGIAGPRLARQFLELLGRQQFTFAQAIQQGDLWFNGHDSSPGDGGWKHTKSPERMMASVYFHGARFTRDEGASRLTIDGQVPS